MTSLTNSYRFCERITFERAKNFAYAFVFLPTPKKKAMNAVYAFARVVDDIADDTATSLEEKRRGLDQCRWEFKEALQGRPRGPLFIALSHAIHSFQIPEKYFFELIEGMEMDLEVLRYADFASLWKYCYHAASVVGLITTEIFGYKDPKAREYAIDMGIALQLTNIIRDIQEDLDRGRIYLPQEDLSRFSLSEEDLREKKMNLSFENFMKFQVQRTEEYYQKASHLFPLIHRNAIYCPATLWEIYHQILKKIEKENFNVFLKKIRLSGKEKLSIALNIWLKSLIF